MLDCGKVLNETYKIMETIGEGGAGVVYKAYHLRLEKYVVLKLIKDDVKDKLNTRTEADILKNLKHTYLPQVTDFLQADGCVYTVMDFVPGKSFAQELREGRRFSQKQVVKWAVQLCEALEYLHKQSPKIIHSDIKPANIMLTPQEDVCLIDFNISQIFSGKGAVPLGRTDGYAPPEQYSAWEIPQQTLKPERNFTAEITDATELDEDATALKTNISKEVSEKAAASAVQRPNAENVIKAQENTFTANALDERSDIYALGAALYHILSGQKPAKSICPVLPISQTGIAVSDGLSCIISKAMEKNPKKRFASASEMLKALRNIHKLEKSYKRSRRKQEIASIAVIIAFAASAVTATAGWQTMQHERSDKYYYEAENAAAMAMNGDTEQAKQAALKAVEAYPLRASAHYAAALAFFKGGDYEGTISYYSSIVADKLEAADSYDFICAANLEFICASAYFELEKYADAITHYEKAIKRNAQNPEYYRDYAISLARLGDTDKAQQVLNSAEKNNMSTDSVLLVKGEIAFAQKSYDEAEKAFLKVIETSTDGFALERAYVLCAKAYKSENNLNAEITLLEKAKNTLPVNNSLLITELLGDAYAVMAQTAPNWTEEYTEKSITCFNELIDRGYNRLYIYHNIAILYQNIGKLDMALQALDNMEKAFPDNYRTHMQRAFVYADVQNALANEKRSYEQVHSEYLLAEELYKKSPSAGNDTQMIMLEDLINEIKNGGWLN